MCFDQTSLIAGSETQCALLVVLALGVWLHIVCPHSALCISYAVESTADTTI